MDNAEILSILNNIGARVPSNSRLILVGGGALALLGSPRLETAIGGSRLVDMPPGEMLPRIC